MLGYIFFMALFVTVFSIIALITQGNPSPPSTTPTRKPMSKSQRWILGVTGGIIILLFTVGTASTFTTNWADLEYSWFIWALGFGALGLFEYKVLK